MEENRIEFLNDLNKYLQLGRISVAFTKADGTLRRMLCTTNAKLIPEENLSKSEKSTVKNDDVFTVWDLDKEAWRRFRKDSVISYYDV